MNFTAAKKPATVHRPSHAPSHHQHHPDELRLLFWETTAGCNLECVHCRRLDVSKALMKNDMTTAESFAFLDNVASFAKPIIVLSGGEPLFRPDIFHIAEHARSLGLPVALATNGTLIDSEMADRIVEAGIQRVAISIDGVDTKTHDEFRRQPGSLERALTGFLLLKFLGMSMQINCTITRHNVHQVGQIYTMARELGAHALHYFMLVPVGCGMEIAESNMLPADVYEEVLELVYRLSQEGKLHIKATCAPHYHRIMRQLGAKEGARPISTVHEAGHQHGMAATTKGCLAGSAVCFVSHTGDVFPCGYLPVTAGNVRRQSLREIWETSALFMKLRDPDALEGKCGVCEFKRICMGCRARAYYEHHDFMAEEPYCVYKPKRYASSQTAGGRSAI
jgi:heme b synthase